MSTASSTSGSFKVLVSDPVDADVKTKLTEDEICGIIGKYDALMVRSGTKVTGRVIDCATKMRIIGRAGVGVDNVDIPAATRKGIYVVNSPYGNVIAAAEMAFGMMICLVRQIAPGDASVRSGRWDRATFVGTQLHQKTLGIVGLGQVGSHLAKLANAAGMKVQAYDPYVNESKAKSVECTLTDSLATLLKTSDLVSLHLLLNNDTRLMIDAKCLSMMKTSARIINTSRGGIIDETALAAALSEGKLAGAALDVFEVEKPFPVDHPLLKAPNLLLTPHLGASTEEAQKFVSVDTAAQIVETLKGQLPTSAVNTPLSPSPELTALQPLMKCCEAVGRIVVQLLQGPLEMIQVALEGDFAEKKDEPLLLAVAAGALSVHSDGQNVNYVNVKQIATQHQIRLAVSKEPALTKQAVRVTVTSATGSASVTGSMTADQTPILKAIQNVPVFLCVPPANDTLIYCEIECVKTIYTIHHAMLSVEF